MTPRIAVPRRPRRRVSTSSAARVLVMAACSFAGLGVLAGCGVHNGSTAGVIDAVGAENEYADVLTQIGGRYVHVQSILNNPNTDPHTFESSPKVAEEVSSAQLIVQNGVGYDSFMNKIEQASTTPGRKVIVAQNVLGLPDSTPNPHLWYSPKTMPAVAGAMERALAAIQPAHASYFESNLSRFDSSLDPWLNAIKQFRSSHPDVRAATTEPVADYLLEAMGIHISTPWRFQADIMNGVDPAPQDITTEQDLFSGRRVQVFCYNQQVVDSLTISMRQRALHDGVPVVGVYETMPTPGFDYQSWMLAEVRAVSTAVEDGRSTEHL